jgi:hypothetical protein
MFAINKGNSILGFLRFDRKNVRAKVRGCISPVSATEKEMLGFDLAILTEGGEKYYLLCSQRKQRLLECFKNKRIILNGLVNFSEKVIIPLNWKPVDPPKPDLDKDATWTGVVIHLRNFRGGGPSVLRQCSNF